MAEYIEREAAIKSFVPKYAEEIANAIPCVMT